MDKLILNHPSHINDVRVIQDEEETAEALLRGEKVARYEWGDSMSPVLKHGEYAILTPITDKSKIKRGDAVFCKMDNHYYMTHMVWEISDSGFDGERWFKIGSTGTDIYGWTKDVLAIARGTNLFQQEIFEEIFD